MLLSKYWSDITQISHSSLGDNGPENKKMTLKSVKPNKTRTVMWSIKWSQILKMELLYISEWKW